MHISATIPAKPTIFHGREQTVNSMIYLLRQSSTARLAVIGSGGMGKTAVTVAVLHDERLDAQFGNRQWFLLCEALADVDSIVIALAKLFGLKATNDLLYAVTTHLTNNPRDILVLDNIETVWLAGGFPDETVEELLGRLSQIQSLWLIITCRGNVLPQSVDWSNRDGAALEPFSLEAAVKTFEDNAGHLFAETGKVVATRLLSEVDHMPLAVSLLGQLVRHGSQVPDLVEHWERDHTALLCTYSAGQFNSVTVSAELSISMLIAANDSRESLQLLSVCTMLPDGLSPRVFEKMCSQFVSIDVARDNWTVYALAGLTSDRVVKTLSPIRHVVLERYPAESNNCDALYSIYFEIADQLPDEMVEQFKDLAVIAVPEIGNLTSLLLTIVNRPSQKVVDAVVRLTRFAYWLQPNTTVASALLRHLESDHHLWRAQSLFATGRTQILMDNFGFAVGTLADAAWEFVMVGDRAPACRKSCKCLARLKRLTRPPTLWPDYFRLL